MKRLSNVSTWNKTVLLEKVLSLTPTTPELGLESRCIQTPGSEAQVQLLIEELDILRKVNVRYSKIRYMSDKGLESVLKKLYQSGKIYSYVLTLQADLHSAGDEPALYLWNETGIVESLAGTISFQTTYEVANAERTC